MQDNMGARGGKCAWCVLSVCCVPDRAREIPYFILVVNSQAMLPQWHRGSEGDGLSEVYHQEEQEWAVFIHLPDYTVDTFLFH